MEFRGQKNVEELSKLLRDESPRCAVIVAAAFFDETLARLLGDTSERSFYVRIEDALLWGLLTQNERDDLHAVRKLRNAFAHDLRVSDFDKASTVQVDCLKLWVTASQGLPLHRVIQSTMQKLLYVVGVIGFRLQHRTKPSNQCGPLPEPGIRDVDAWPPVTDR